MGFDIKKFNKDTDLLIKALKNYRKVNSCLLEIWDEIERLIKADTVENKNIIAKSIITKLPIYIKCIG